MSGVTRLRMSKKLKAEREQRDAPPAPKRERAPHNPPVIRPGALASHETFQDAHANETYEQYRLRTKLGDMTQGSHDPSSYAPCCDAAPHAGVEHEGPHTTDVKAREKWEKAQARARGVR